ncbi:beta-N-acetylhexosaminidase [Paenibacillus glycanilyticus]|uniref:Glycoside hydrolase family 3 n=1 Tax=Paenibacillus glycanilyticus TaxID=126569 RepID=A0ABQ6GI47_9BACL|nr:beta-N-acetylhexosaminidase [Paenibacillus glycanilyticus]GLX70621.1 glycoside hydrolase family 3 [Paenibacillus glycanilyticus]
MRLHRIYCVSAAACMLIVLVLGGCMTKHPSPSAPVTEPEVDPIATLVQSMSLPEKIGQMVVVGLDGTEVEPPIRSLIADSHVGGIILYGNNIVSATQTNKLVNDLKHLNQTAGAKLPLLISTDQEGGRVSRLPKEFPTFPSSKAVGRTKDADYAYQVGSSLGEAMSAVGLNTDFAPVLDVNTNPDNPVIGDRAFGSTAELVSSMGVQEMLGIQSQGVIPVVKHFPGHGDTSVDSHFGLPVVDHDLNRLRSVEFVPFRAAIEKGAPVVMVAHILMNKLDPNLPASMSRKVIQDLLRGELKFDGVVITDDMTMGAVGKVMPIGPASVHAVLAGADLILVGHVLTEQQAVLRALTTAVQNGDIPQSVIDKSVYRIVKLKQSYRLSDQPTPLGNLKKLNEHIKAALNHSS